MTQKIFINFFHITINKISWTKKNLYLKIFEPKKKFIKILFIESIHNKKFINSYIKSIYMGILSVHIY